MCIARFAHTSYIQYFADNRHRFYVEIRCNRPCEGSLCDRCKNCNAIRSNRQHIRTFNHGNVNEPIPDHSHIYGGKWYQDGCNKWGAPPSEIMEFAIMYQMEARNGVSISHNVASKAEPNVESNAIMPRSKKIVEDVVIPVIPDVVPVKIKRGRKPKVGAVHIAPPTIENEESATSASKAEPSVESNAIMPRSKKIVEDVVIPVVPVKVKRGRKPKVGAVHIAPPTIENEESKESKESVESVESAESAESVESANKPQKPQKRKPSKKVNENETIPKGSTRRKKPTEPYSSIIQQNHQQQESVKENTIPTHIEHTMEEINSDDYEIEYVKLTLQEIGLITYFRDNKKNKLYKRIKDKHVGEYIGRYHPNTGEIHTDIPDSDEEE